MRHLLLTLGHNSSAILLDGGMVLCGYETERITKIKSDSSFPAPAIEEIQKTFTIPDDIHIYVSHWFIDTADIDKTSKWWNFEYLNRKFPQHTVYSLSQNFTHHDAHCYSAVAFAKNSMPMTDTLIMVADGFGNYGETMSLYRLKQGIPELTFRAYGFDTSLGLMYQYATAYLGLKMNQDEYKLLGYEAHIGEVDVDMCKLNADIESHGIKMATKLMSTVSAEFDPTITIGALPATQASYYAKFNKLCKKYGVPSDHSRPFIAYFVQGVLEYVFNYIISAMKTTNIILVGGVFMNVKLNNSIAKIVKGKTSIMPLSGDNGAAIGVYEYMNHDFIWPNHLFWGRRDLTGLQSTHDFQVLPYVETVALARLLLDGDCIVNLVGSSMEYGARALGMTSTLAKPTKENVEYINNCNHRSTIMPMAGFCREEDVSYFHPDSDKIVDSMKYMVCTRDYNNDVVMDVRGAAHNTPDCLTMTGRTQTVESGHILHAILNKRELLINTSFNPHGKPIVYDKYDIVHAHEFMKKNDPDGRVYTIIYEDKISV